MSTIAKDMNPILKQIPDRITDTEVLYFLRNEDINYSYVQEVKDITNLPDQIISKWLNISVKTFKTYKKPSIELKENIKEQLILLLSLFKHGKEVFGNSEIFYRWLNTENFFLDQGKPIDLINTISGIRFINDRLTAMEFGDNV